MGCVIAAGEGYGAGLAVSAPLERRFAVGVTGGGNVRQLQGGGVVLAFKGDLGGVNRHALFGAGGSGLDSGGNLSSPSLHVGCVIAAGEGHGAGLAVGAPQELRLTVGVAGDRNHLPGVDVFGDLLGAGLIGKVLAAAGAVPVGLGAFLRAGGSHVGNRFYLVLHGYGDGSGGGGTVAQLHSLLGHGFKLLSGVGDGEVHILAGLVLVDGARELASVDGGGFGAVNRQGVGILAVALNLGTVQHRDGVPVDDEVGGIAEGVVADAQGLIVGNRGHIQHHIHPVGFQLHVLAEHGHGLGTQRIVVGDGVGVVDVFLDGHLPAGEHAVFGDEAGGLRQIHGSALVIDTAVHLLTLGDTTRQVTAGGIGDGVLLYQTESHAVPGFRLAGVAVSNAVGFRYPLALALVKGQGNGLGGGVGVVPAVVAGEMILMDICHPGVSRDGGFAGPHAVFIFHRLGEGDAHQIVVAQIPASAEEDEVMHGIVYLGLMAVDSDIEVGAVFVVGSLGAVLGAGAGHFQGFRRQLPAALFFVVYGGQHQVIAGVVHTKDAGAGEHGGGV